jgi:hypothetical protein
VLSVQLLVVDVFVVFKIREVSSNSSVTIWSRLQNSIMTSLANRSSQRRQGAVGNNQCIRCNSNYPCSRFLDPDLLGTTAKLAGGAGRLLPAA